jgi:PAS domain S-box-containing protein
MVNPAEHPELLLRRISQVSLLAIVCMGAVSLAGWISGRLILTSISPDYVPIAPSSALCFIILATALLVHVSNTGRASGRMAAITGACLTILICSGILIGFSLGTALEAEHLGIRASEFFSPGSKSHMSPFTAAIFLLAALGVLFLALSSSGRERLKSAAALIGTAVGVIGCIVLLGYMHGMPLLYGGTIKPISLPTAVAFGLFGLGLITAAGPHVTPVRVFTGPAIRNRLMRAFIPAIAAFVLMNGLLFKITYTRTANPALITSLITLLSVIIVSLLISKIAQSIGDEIDRAHVERNKAVDEIRFLASIVQNLPNAVCAMDMQGRMTAWNRGAEKLLGYRSEEVIGKPVATIIPDEFVSTELEHCLVMLQAHGGFSGYESIRLAKDGRRVPVELIGVAIRDKTQKIESYATIMVDIRNRKKAEAERLKGHTLESIGILAGGIAHDFNNLLTALLGNIGIAKMFVQPNDKIFSRLTDAEQICEIAGELSKRLLTFATGGDPVRKIMALPGFIKDTIDTLTIGTTLSPEYGLPADLPEVAIDEGQMKQVLTNLVLNAQDAMPQGGTVVIRGENLLIAAQDSLPIQEGHYVRISVRDTGVGIPAENLARIFDPYYSTKDTYSRKGLGLGLAVCYSVIKRHDGLITVESEVGKGTVFYMYLPAADRA